MNAKNTQLNSRNTKNEQASALGNYLALKVDEENATPPQMTNKNCMILTVSVALITNLIKLYFSN